MALTSIYFHVVIVKPLKRIADDFSKLLTTNSAHLPAQYGVESSE